MEGDVDVLGTGFDTLATIKATVGFLGIRKGGVSLFGSGKIAID